MITPLSDIISVFKTEVTPANFRKTLDWLNGWY